MLNASELRRQCKQAARLEIQRGGFWSCISAIALIQIPAALLLFAMNLKLNPALELLMQSLNDDTITLEVYLEQLTSTYGYIGIFGIASLLLLSPLTFGGIHYCMMRAHGQRGDFSDILICFSRLKKYITVIKTELCIGLFSVLWSILLVGGATLIAIGLILLTAPMISSFGMLLLVIVLVYALIIIAALYASARIMRYTAAYIFLIEDENMGSWRAVRESTRLFQGRTWELFLFQMSFLGWNILSAVTMNLFNLYVFPYNHIALIHYVDALRAPELPRRIEPSIRV